MSAEMKVIPIRGASPIPQEMRGRDHWARIRNTPSGKAPDIELYRDGTTAYDNDCQGGCSFTLAKKCDLGFGYLFNESSPTVCFDIDFPESIKGEKARIVEDIEADPHLYQQYFERTLDQIRGTKLEALLTETYTELSVSKLGLHVMLNVEEKQLADRSIMKFKSHGQCTVHHGFVVFTENPYPGSPSKLKTVSFAEFEQIINEMGYVKRKMPSSVDVSYFNQQSTGGSIATKERVQDALDLLPLNQGNKIKKAWSKVRDGAVYSHYDYWLTIGMALSNWAKEAICPDAFQMWSEWSKKDLLAASSDEELASKWYSFAQSDDGIVGPVVSVGTIFALANEFKIQYPHCIIKKDGEKTNLPKPNMWENYQCLLDFYEIERQNSGVHHYIVAPKEIGDKYFLDLQGVENLAGSHYGPVSEEGLRRALLRLCQDNGFISLSSTKEQVQTWISQRAKEFNLFNALTETKFEDLHPDLKKGHVIYTDETRRGVEREEFNVDLRRFDGNSHLDYVFDLLDVQAEDEEQRSFFKRGFEAGFMQTIKGCCEKDKSVRTMQNSIMINLVGVQGCGKSSFISSLFPPLLMSNSAIVGKPKGKVGVSRELDRDNDNAMCGTAIFVADEGESVFDFANYSSQVKEFITGISSQHVQKYKTASDSKIKTASIFSTSNHKRTIQEDDGSRRQFNIPVGQVDAWGLSRVNWHTFWCSVRAKYFELRAKNKFPWQLSTEDVRILQDYNRENKAKTNSERHLESVFAYGKNPGENYLLNIANFQKDISGALLSQGAIRDILSSRGISISPSDLVNKVEMMSAAWIKDNGIIIPSKWNYSNGAIRKKGKRDIWYVMPPQILEHEGFFDDENTLKENEEKDLT